MTPPPIKVVELIFSSTCESRKQYQSKLVSKNKHIRKKQERCKDLQHIKMAPPYQGVRPVISLKRHHPDRICVIRGEVRQDYWDKYRDTKPSGIGINDTKQS